MRMLRRRIRNGMAVTSITPLLLAVGHIGVEKGQLENSEAITLAAAGCMGARTGNTPKYQSATTSIDEAFADGSGRDCFCCTPREEMLWPPPFVHLPPPLHCVNRAGFAKVASLLSPSHA